MKLTKDELIAKIREHGGESPDDFTISMLEDISDSIDDSALETLKAEKQKLEEAYEALKKAYADRFTIKEDEKSEEDEPETIETYDSIFD